MPKLLVPAGLLLIGLGCATPAREQGMSKPTPAPPEPTKAPAPQTPEYAAPGIEAPAVTLTASESSFDLSSSALGRVTPDGFELRPLSPGAAAVLIPAPKARALCALSDGRWVGLAEAPGGYQALVLSPRGEEQSRFTMTEVPRALRLLPGAEAVWLASKDSLVRYPLKPTIPGVYISDIRIDKEAPRPISLTSLTDGTLVGVYGADLVRYQGADRDRSWRLPVGVSGQVRIAEAGNHELWLAGSTGPLVRVRPEETLHELATIATPGAFALATGGGRVAWLDVVEAGPAGPGTWTLRVATDAGEILMTKELPASGKRAFEDVSERDLRLSPDGKVVAVGGRGGVRAWMVDGGAEMGGM